MGVSDQLARSIEAIHRAPLEPRGWDAGLAAVGELTSARAISLDGFALPELRHSLFRCWNMRPMTQAEYLAIGPAPNRRVQFAVANPRMKAIHDADIFADETEIDREPFYAEFLSRHDCRYFGASQVEREPGRSTYITVMRSPRQPAVEPEDLALLRVLAPHVRLSLEVGRRLGEAEVRARLAFSALDWLSDAVAVLDRGGRVLHANRALEQLAARADGVALLRGAVALTDRPARRRLEAAVAGCAALAAREGHAAPAEFPVRRPSGLPPLLASVRPVFVRDELAAEGACCVLFLRDPCAEAARAAQPLAEVFGLTPAEADLAEALCGGEAPAGYARGRGVSINTVYTHLRRLKEKTETRRLPELIHRLKDAAPASLRG